MYVDVEPYGGSRVPGDTAVAGTCTTDAAGDCTVDDLASRPLLGRGRDTAGRLLAAADQAVVAGQGVSVSLTFVDPRLHKVVVIVCHEGTNTLAPSDVTDEDDELITLDATDSTIRRWRNTCAACPASPGSRTSTRRQR